MRQYLIKVLLTTVPLILALIVYEYSLRKQSLPNIYSFKNQLIQSKYEGIVLGNSHALRGVLAEDLNRKCINLANVSQSIDIDIVWIKEAIKINKLNFVVLSVSIPTLLKTLSKSKENWRIKNYNIYN